jgi:hypothetical protein
MKMKCERIDPEEEPGFIFRRNHNEAEVDKKLL